MKKFVGLRAKTYSYLTDDGKLQSKEKREAADGNLWSKLDVFLHNITY